MRYVAGALNDYNYSEPTYADEIEIPCSFADEGGDEATNTLLDVPKADATFWITPDIVVTPQYRIRLTRRFGVAVTTQNIYQVVGEPSRDVLLQKITAKLLPEHT
jgi:hypothetical protein